MNLPVARAFPLSVTGHFRLLQLVPGTVCPGTSPTALEDCVGSIMAPGLGVVIVVANLKADPQL